MDRRTLLQAAVGAPLAFVGMRSAAPGNPAANPTTATPPIARHLPRAFTSDELAAILATVRADQWRPAGWDFCGHREPAKWWLARVLVGWDTGISTMTLFQVACRDVDLASRTLTVRAEFAKSGFSMSYHLSEAAVESLADGMLPAACAPLFPWTGYVQTYFKHYRRLLKAAGVAANRKGVC